MESHNYSKVLCQSSGPWVVDLARPVMEKYPVRVLRKPAKTLVMIKMRETVAKAQFYLGEMLACEAMVELEGKKGFALMMGDDTQKVMAAAVVDALRKTDLPEKEPVLRALEQRKQELEKELQQDIARHARSKVQFETLDVSY